VRARRPGCQRCQARAQCCRVLSDLRRADDREFKATRRVDAGSGLVAAHAALRAPNLKARLATQARAREEFRAVWRGYSAGHDYNA